MKQLTFSEQNFLKLFSLRKNISFEDFSKELAVLNGSDTSGQYVVRSDLDTFVERVAKKDNRKSRLDLYKRKLYKVLVEHAEDALLHWFRKTAGLTENINFYFQIPNSDLLTNDTFAGRTNAKYGRVCKNINFENFYNTRKLYSNDFEYTLGLMKAMFENFKIRNSLVGPAMFDHVCKIEDDYSQFWADFMMGCNRASVFNPATYKGILDNLFTGDVLFAPCMGWNAYQLAFYSSNFKKFIATDVIPDVVTNSRLLHQEFLSYQGSVNSIFTTDQTAKETDFYLCPSEQLAHQHGFDQRYLEQVDAVLFSPPYFDLEIYNSQDQSVGNFPNYQDWLTGYWEATVQLCKTVMKPGARFGFVISNYRNADKVVTTISEDMRDVAAQHLDLVDHYRVQWSAIGGSRQAKKTRGGNFEDLWLFQK